MTETSFCSHFVSADKKDLTDLITPDVCEGLKRELKSVI
jgi:hypothetical protein